MTLAELHAACPTFRALMAAWDADRRAPYCLADYLREQGFPHAAELADWAASAPVRNVYCPLDEWGERKTPCGPYPTTVSTAHPGWYLRVHVHGNPEGINTAEELPSQGWVWVTGGDELGIYTGETPVETLLVALAACGGKISADSLTPSPS